MKQIIRKLFWAWEFDKEEKWLNEMSAKGLQLCEVGIGRYVFDEGLPSEYAYRLEFLDYFPRNKESIKYIKFIEDTGAEYICSLHRWVYFRKKADKCEFNLFSDIDSKVKHLNRILLLTGVFSIINLMNAAIQFFSWKNFIESSICLTIGMLIGYGFLCTFMKKRKLQKDKILHE